MGADGWDIDFNLLWAEIVEYYSVMASFSISFTDSEGEIVTIPYLWLFGGVLILDAIINVVLGFTVQEDDAYDDV